MLISAKDNVDADRNFIIFFAGIWYQGSLSGSHEFL